MDDHGLVQDAHPPLQRGPDVVLVLLELEAQDVLDVASDDVLVAEPGQLARAAAGADHAGLLVEDEEGGVRRRVVILEKLEQEAEAALLTPLRPSAEPGGAVARLAARPAVGADEVRHRP